MLSGGSITPTSRPGRDVLPEHIADLAGTFSFIGRGAGCRPAAMATMVAVSNGLAKRSRPPIPHNAFRFAKSHRTATGAQEMNRARHIGRGQGSERRVLPSASPFPEFTMAFQPIVDTAAGGTLFAYESLLRGRLGESAASVFATVPPERTLAFDAACRERAVEMVASFGARCGLSLNVSASAICDHRYGLRTTLRAAQRVGWPAGRLIFEMTEQEPIENRGKLARWIAAARNRGVTVAIDDFGAGYAGINSLLQLRPDMVKLDMGLVHGIDADRSRRAIVKGVVDACAVFGCRVVGEGVETEAEFVALASLGIGLMQGYVFARPGFACLPEIVRPVALTS